MAETLVERIRRIENVPDYISIDRDQEMREEFEKLRMSNSVVNELMSSNGRISFLKKFQGVIANYESLDESDMPKEVAELDSCIGDRYHNIDRAYNVNAPETLGIGLGAIGAISGLAIAAVAPSKMRKRTFIKAPLVFSSGLGLVGAVVGAIGNPSAVKSQLGILEQNAKHLDEVYARLYGRTSELREPSLLVSNYFQRFGITSRA